MSDRALTIEIIQEPDCVYSMLDILKEIEPHIKRGPNKVICSGAKYDWKLEYIDRTYNGTT